MDLHFRPGDGDVVLGFLSRREGDGAVVLLLNMLNLVSMLGKQAAVDPTLHGKLLVNDLFQVAVDHVHDLILHKVKAGRVASRSTADNVFNFDIFLLTMTGVVANAAIHRIGELEEHRVLLHNTLDMSASNADYTLVVLIRDMKRYGRRHFRFDKVQAVLDRLVTWAADHDVKIVFVESVEEDLDVSQMHDLVYFAIFLATDELLVLVCQFDLDFDVVDRALNEGHDAEYSKGELDLGIGAVDPESAIRQNHFGS